MLIVYFSGTGNTRHLAKKLAALLNCESSSIEEKQTEVKLAQSAQVILAYPVYFSGPPKIISEFVESQTWQNKQVFLLTTCGLMNGGAIKSMAETLKAAGAAILGGMSFQMPENIGDNALFMKVLPPSGNNKKIVKAEIGIELLAAKIKRGDYPQKGLRMAVSTHVNSDVKMKIDETKCNHCGLCKKLCPYQEEYGTKCTLCYRCYANCPQQAITGFGKKVVVQYTFEKELE
ncbi:MAG: EFR1 family ferrodoxin [Erysipelotrichaceae bacterium]|jgi:flavodoxin/ferredoxin|nr:EFR1 family ferrodoxin [Erysipelotrichaceae bacterium]